MIFLNRYHLKITGDVQFVGFRYFALNTASDLNLSGWARNCYDGSVEIEVQGNDEDIKEFIKRLYEGNGYSSVDDIDSEKINCKLLERGFKIVY